MPGALCTLAVLLVQLPTPAEATDATARAGRFTGGFSLAGAAPLADPRQRTDYTLMRQLDYSISENRTVGLAFGLAGSVESLPQTALQLQMAHYFTDTQLSPYTGVHLGMMADLVALDFAGTTGIVAGLRYALGPRWSLTAEARPSATFPRWRDSFVALAIGFSLLADPI